MAINFPANPNLNDTFTVGNTNYVWDGTKWTASVTGGIALDKITEGNTSAEVIDTGTDGRVVFTTEGNEVGRFDASGRFGIGTASPSALLTAAGPIRSEQSGNRITMNHDGVNGAITTTAGQFLVYANGANNIIAHTNSTERVRISSTGALGFSGANYGSSGQVLTSQGSGAAPQWATPSGGAWTYISSVTASNSSSVAFTSGIDSTYAFYAITYANVYANSDGPEFGVRFSSNGGASYYSGSADYKFTRIQSTGLAQISYNNTLLGELTTTSTGYGAQAGMIYLFEPSSASKTSYWQTGLQGRNAGWLYNTGGQFQQAVAVNAIQFFPSSGLLTSGTFRLYGIKNS